LKPVSLLLLKAVEDAVDQSIAENSVGIDLVIRPDIEL
jgi:hypothetical protein